MSSDIPSHPYLTFLNLVQAFRAGKEQPELDTVEEKLLNTFAAAWHTGSPLTVMEVMGGLPDISRSTVQRRLNSLREKGLIALESDTDDRRVKYIVSTPKSVKYFSELCKCLDQAQAV